MCVVVVVVVVVIVEILLVVAAVYIVDVVYYLSHSCQQLDILFAWRGEVTEKSHVINFRHYLMINK